MKVSRVSEMRDLDREAAKTYGIPEEILMENAGLASCQVISREMGIQGRRFAVFCGAGNNGGDGFVVARKILSEGGSARVYLLGARDQYRGAARQNLEILSRITPDLREVTSAKAIRLEVLHCDAVVDALFGTGLAREVEGLHRDIIGLINECRGPVFSLDIPSGVNGDTGAIMGDAVKADFTIAFGLPKIGNVLYPGFGRCGSLYVAHISFPPALYRSEALRIETNEPVELPPRRPWGHKGDFGEALFVAGAPGYLGAPCFAALSFLRAGGGYSRLAAPGSITPFLANRGSEIVFLPQRETSSGSLSLKNKKALLDISGKMDVVVVGPGLSLAGETQRLVRELLRGIEKPVIVDGDGLTAISSDLIILKGRKAPTVLTPHAGEMARLTGMKAADIEKRRVEVVQRAAKDLRSIIVLKGAHSLVGCPDGRVWVNLTGNSGMATAGSGDVLTGSIAAMIGLGLALPEAVRMGAFVHGLAGDLAAADRGEDGMTAQDILESLPYAMKTVREGGEELAWGKIRMV